MNPDLERLQPYPFEKLAALKQGIQPPRDREPIALQIGEPKHPTPSLIADALLAHLHQLSVYPTTRGTPELRAAIARWLIARFQLAGGDGSRSSIDPERQILPVNGTREALFAFAQAVVDRSRAPLVLTPNPFYQIYEGAALLAGAKPRYLACRAENGFLPDFDAVDEATWKRCQLLYICSPGNPTGAVFDSSTFARLIELAHRHDFVIASDECYSELYLDENAPPLGLLQVAAAIGNASFSRCMVFHSLSKRSNAPGLRSGFVAGDAELIERFFAYRTYHGCAMSLPIQSASRAAWGDESHVRENRRLYRDKFAAVLDILGDVLPMDRPAAGFYLWPETPIPDTEFARRLYAEENLSVLPGSFLSREVAGENPGENRVRLALVPPLDECVDAARRILRCVERIRREQGH
ncbi:succinyldiaminopimelate transaminase [Thiocystis violascens]|uniref:Succinyldiaminopimelate aminotransferase apoenzyme n=1 Tax=Thiocystis violascens (strain ATCC 17096 / DSM 198 / 6111) TaxID=765911 RepID=I3YC23_THIV6|nr:succinyldiaminopimelate transaminase [Thiocystis violascens]AFL74541.1 succinyldiaminopimelate aminotransferase apoenzyme [Thiocystis violascens DSM 198]